jgi:hypothetical protein
MTADEFAAALGGEQVGTVERDGDVWVWSCDCGDKGECGDETTAATTLYFHRRSGHQQILDVQIGGTA